MEAGGHDERSMVSDNNASSVCVIIAVTFNYATEVFNNNCQNHWISVM